MQATIKLKDGEYIEIDNLQLIRQHESTYVKAIDITDFEMGLANMRLVPLTPVAFE